MNFSNNPLENKSCLNRAKNSSMDLTEARKRAEDHLLYTICQNGQPLERYVEDFLEYSHLVSWSNSTLKACFRMGLDDLFQFLAPAKCYLPLVNYINYILGQNGSDFVIKLKMTLHTLNPVPSRQHTN